MDVEEAYKSRRSGIPLTTAGEVERILEDDHEGIHHQRFIIKVSAEQTVLIAHNLDRAYRAPVEIGDKVEVRGTYQWNKLGGIIHNTHHDDRKGCEKTSGGKVVCGPKHEDGGIVFVGEKDPHRTKNYPEGGFKNG